MIALGVDIGGTGCKCAAFSDNGEQLALEYMEYPAATMQGSLSPDVLWNCVATVITGCAARLANRADIACITVSSFGESFVALDTSGNPLSDIPLYFANSHTEEFERLVERVGAGEFMEITRILPDASYSLAKMLTARKLAQREIWKYLFIASYITWRLSGETVCDISLACRSLLLDVKAGCWSDKLMAAAGIDESQLPEVLPAGSLVGSIRRECAVLLGVPESVKIVLGAHDQIVNALGSGVWRAGDAVNTTGSSECITPLFTSMPDISFIKDNYACVPYLDGLGYVTYAYNVSGGFVVKWFRDSLAAHLHKQATQEQISVYDLMNRTCPQEPTSLIVLPYLQGMGGTPNVKQSATGYITGLTTASTLPQIYRGILEGLCFEMLYNLERLKQSGIKPARLFACGGGARSGIWLQIKADVWGREIIPVRTEETGALGGAILGFAALTKAKSCSELAKRFVRHEARILPNKERHAYYQEQFKRYCKLRDFSLMQ